MATDCIIIGNTVVSHHDALGGGISCRDSASPTITDCTINGNEAVGADGGGHGGGIWASYYASPAIANCTITCNLVDGFASPGRGGGIYCRGGTTILGCTIMENSAGAVAGGIFAGLNAVISDCVISGNVAGGSGGGIALIDSAKMVNCLIVGNTVGGGLGFSHVGGGVACSGNSLLANCVIIGNSTSEEGGGIAVLVGSDTTTLSNSIVWSNGAANGKEIAVLFSSVLSVSSCDVAGGPLAAHVDEGAELIWGTGNIDADPLFVDPNNGDYRLSPGSPCIDAGHNWGVPSDTADVDDDGDVRELTPLDLDGNPRFVNDPATPDTGCGVPIPFAVDMGAYEFPGKAASNTIYLGDLNADRVVGIVDLLALLANWGPADMCVVADLDLDGEVGITDFLILLGNWGP